MRTVQVELTDWQARMARSPSLALALGICAPTAMTLAPLGLYVAGLTGTPFDNPFVLLGLALVYIVSWFGWTFATPTLKAVMQAEKTSRQQQSTGTT